jgi:hypothetical protein
MHVGCTAKASNPDLIVTEILDTVRDSILTQPRSLQKMIGPSEIGHPCSRRLGYKLAGCAEVNARGVAWKPYVGTAVHEQVATIMAAAEVARWRNAGASTTRWHIEERVTVGQILAAGGLSLITGSTDLFDAHHGIVFDWKFTSRNQIRKNYKPHGPGPQYQTQGHLYGRGWVNAGFDVQHVAIIFLTRDGEFSDRYIWHEPYDEQIALRGPDGDGGLERLQRIQTSLDALGPEFVLPALPVVQAYCQNCPWFKAGSTNPAVACPGAPGTDAVRADAFDDLIGTKAA